MNSEEDRIILNKNGDEISKMNKNMDIEKNRLDYNDVIENFEETFFSNNKNRNKIREDISSQYVSTDRKLENFETSDLKSMI